MDFVGRHGGHSAATAAVAHRSRRRHVGLAALNKRGARGVQASLTNAYERVARHAAHGGPLPASAGPLGVFTTMDRDAAAEARSELERHRKRWLAGPRQLRVCVAVPLMRGSGARRVPGVRRGQPPSTRRSGRSMMRSSWCAWMTRRTRRRRWGPPYRRQRRLPGSCTVGFERASQGRCQRKRKRENDRACDAHAIRACGVAFATLLACRATHNIRTERS